MKTKSRAILGSSRSFFLFGPRGTGKTTWLKETFPDAVVIDLLAPSVRRRFLVQPERLAEIVEGRNGTDTFVIDEVQRVPALLDVVHELIDTKPGLRFVLTGSSARKLKRSGNVDLLGGRAVQRFCHPFLACEMGKDFSLPRALRQGMIPLVVRQPEKEAADILQTYLDLYIQEEVTTEGVVRNLDAFARFLEAASFSHGSVISASGIARESGVKRSTVDGYFAILRDMLLTARLPVFAKRAKRALVAHDKFYFFDAGVFRALRPAGPLDRPSEIDGAALEGLVFQHLRAWNDYSGAPDFLGYWRTKAGVEVDFVLYGEKDFAAIEVKNAATLHPSDFTGLKSFREDYPEARTLLLYRGETQFLRDGILVVPAEKFLRSLVPGRPPLEAFSGEAASACAGTD
ncbi:MAG: ATP-binding protein [Kiritimatiellae bacterium]|nr:ATP-binding protein [Kiritimatiellia bacterium]